MSLVRVRLRQIDFAILDGFVEHLSLIALMVAYYHCLFGRLIVAFFDALHAVHLTSFALADHLGAAGNR